MAYNLPGPKTAARLASGKKLFRHGLTYDAAAEESAAKGFIPPAQIILGKTKGEIDMCKNMVAHGDIPGQSVLYWGSQFLRCDSTVQCSRHN